MNNTIHRMTKLTVVALASTLITYMPVANAGHGAEWGIGGLLAGHLLTSAVNRDKERTRAVRSMAYSQPSYVAVPAAPAATTMTPEQKIQQLDKLAAGGYITPAEYRAKKQAILDSL